MPLYTIAPSSRRSMHYNPFSPVLFGHGYGPRHSACAPRSSSASIVPSLFKTLDSELSSLDSFFNDILSSSQQNSQPAIRSFQPRFDVREERDAFHLTGDLPGVEAGNIAVEFVDRDTMVIKGRTVRESRRGNAPVVATTEETKTVEGSSEAQTTAPTAATTEGDVMDAEPTATTSRPATPDSIASNYHKATVEDGRDEEEADDFVDVAVENNNEATATPAAAAAQTSAPSSSSAAETNTATAQQQQSSKPAAAANKEEQGRYWVSERSVGEFSRSFRFPGGQVDRDNVTASLKDGVLKVVVPKIKEQGPRSIRVE